MSDSGEPRDRRRSSSPGQSEPGAQPTSHPTEFAHSGPAPLRIFVSYRREDAGGHALSLYEPLTERFGKDNVFMDIHAIEPGRPFPEVISKWVGSCDVLIALIGRQWATLADAKGRRIDDPKDLVVLEIRAALDRHVRVIPALVQKAEPPTSDVLPKVLRELSDYQAIELSDVRWAFDVGRLIQTLETLEREHEAAESESRGPVTAPVTAPVERPAERQAEGGGWRIPRVGTEIAGYRIEALIGRGGMSDVYLAEHPGLPGRKVALKILSPELAEDEVFRERFVRESRLAAALEHPNIVPIYQAGEFEGSLFIVMRYVDGPDLSGLIESEGRLDPQRTLSILSQVSGALDAAHARELVHRDVKPGNVLIAPGKGTGGRDHAYLSDFGLVRGAQSRPISAPGGPLIGTLAYIAPEQIEGKSVDHRADIYSLGCVLYECLTGQVPFTRDTQTALMWAHVNEPPPPVTAVLPNAPPAIDAVLTRALAKSPDERYSSCADLVMAASSALAPGIGRETTQETVPQELRRPEAATGRVGIPVGASSPPPPMPPLTPTTPSPTPIPTPTTTTPARGSGPNVPLIAGLVVAALVVGIAVVLLMGGGGGTVPTARIDGGPSGLVSETSATIEFSSPEEAATFECSLDGAPFAACTSPVTVDVEPGAHSFRVRAVGDAGTGESVSSDWTVEAGTALPEATITSGPSGTVSEATATFEFTSADEAATFACSLDAAEFVACTSPQTYEGLTNGDHTFQVQVTNAAGDAGPPAAQTWTVQVGSEPFPNAIEQALLLHIPGGVRDACSRSTSEPPEGANASIFCSANVASTGLLYTQFVDAAAMQSYYEAGLAGEVPRNTGSCIDGDPNGSEGTWFIDNEDTGVHLAGRVTCYVDPEDGTAWFEWTEEELLVYVFAFREDGDASALQAWWADGRGGPLP